MSSSSRNRYLPSDPSSFNPDEDDTYGDGRVKNNLLEELYADFGDEADTLNFGNYGQYGLQDVSLLPNPAVGQRIQPQFQADSLLPYTNPFGQDNLDTNNIHYHNVSQLSQMSKPAYTTSHQGSRSTGETLPTLFSSAESIHRPPLVANSTTGRVHGCDGQMKLQLKEETKLSTTTKFEQSESHSGGRVGSTCSFLAEAGTEHISVGSKRRCPGHSESQNCANNQSMRGYVLNHPVRNERLAESSQPSAGGHFEDTLRNVSCSNSYASSPGLPASKRRRTINSGLDLLSEVTEAYGFVRGANIYAPTTHPTFASQYASRAVQPHPVYHFDYSKTINFNFHGADASSRCATNAGANYRSAEGSASFTKHPENPGAISRSLATVSGYRCSESTDSNYGYAEGASGTFSKPQPIQGSQHYLNNTIYASQSNRCQSAASTASCAPRIWYSSPAETTGSPHPPVPSRVSSKFSNSSAAAAYVQDDSGFYNKNRQRNVPVGKARNPYENYTTGNPAMHLQQDTGKICSVSYSYPDYSSMPGYSNMSSNAYCNMELAPNNYLVGHQHSVGNSSFLSSNNEQTAYGSSYSSCRKRPTPGANSYYPNATMHPLGLETIPEFLPDPSNPGENPTVNSDYPQTVRAPTRTRSTEPPSVRSRISRSSCNNVPLIQQSFMKNFFGEGSEPYQTHYLFSLLRDLIIADMNYNTSKFPFNLINNLPTDFDRLLQNYFARNPKLEHHHHDPQVDKLVMEALRHAHKTLLEKIRIHQGIAEGQSSAASNSDIMAGLCENFQTKFPTSDNDDDFSALRSFGGDSRFGWHKPQMMTKPVPLGSDLGYQCDMPPSVNPMFITPSHYNPHSPASTCLSLTTSDGQLDMGDVSFEKTNKNKVLPREAVEVMTTWLREHHAHPYPNDDEKDMFLNRTKLTINQINYWFTNARRRLLPKWELKQRLEKEEHAKHDSGSNQSSAVS